MGDLLLNCIICTNYYENRKAHKKPQMSNIYLRELV